MSDHSCAQAAPAAGASWSRAYELKAVGLLSLGFGLVGLDRFIINPLFPVMARDLGLNYQDMGLISAVLALAWGLSSIFTGRLSDRVGRKRVLVPAVVVFSLLVATSGLATGLGSLLAIRALMGLAEGAYVPASIVATIEASKPSRIGLNIGLQQTAAPLVGLGLGPVVAVGLLQVMPSWHWVFGVLALPGLVVAWLLARTLREHQPDPEASAVFKTRWWEVLRYRDVVAGTLAMCCLLSGLIVLSAFMPNYLTDHLRLDLTQMGGVLAGIGVGSCLGMVLLPALSDRCNLKLLMLAAMTVELVALWILPGLGTQPLALFATLFVATFMNAGVVAIIVGPITHRAVPTRLVTTATGIVVGLGEVVGGALAPALTGGLAQHLGIHVVPLIALGAIVLGVLVVAAGLRTAPVPQPVAPASA
ncbi:MFS transporter [Ideonella livida]|uniref:MFS transporter n=1 Tax=Ideonella livida TaxID=2707176 RepID=A0A7C9PJX4_9BURK|nr:MFS transporter [Ideonella livida]NDY93529.1 MFS transporter [Ideonella livida]